MTSNVVRRHAYGEGASMRRVVAETQCDDCAFVYSMRQDQAGQAPPAASSAARSVPVKQRPTASAKKSARGARAHAARDQNEEEHTEETHTTPPSKQGAQQKRDNAR